MNFCCGNHSRWKYGTYNWRFQFGLVKMPIWKNNWDEETYRNKLEICMYWIIYAFLGRSRSKIQKPCYFELCPSWFFLAGFWPFNGRSQPTWSGGQKIVSTKECCQHQDKTELGLQANCTNYQNLPRKLGRHRAISWMTKELFWPI